MGMLWIEECPRMRIISAALPPTARASDARGSLARWVARFGGLLLAAPLLCLVVPAVSYGSPGAPEAVLKCRGVPATIVGTPGDDVIQGTSGDDVIVAGAGNDFISGNGGDDLICGGPT